jgi:hypothetical protein
MGLNPKAVAVAMEKNDKALEKVSLWVFLESDSVDMWLLSVHSTTDSYVYIVLSLLISAVAVGWAQCDRGQAEAKKAMWRQKHESFVKTIREARQVQQVGDCHCRGVV